MSFRLKCMVHLVISLIIFCALMVLLNSTWKLYELDSNNRQLQQPQSEPMIVISNIDPHSEDNEDLSVMTEGQEVFPLSSIENDLLYREPINVAFIFTKAKKNHVLQYNLRKTVASLLSFTSAPLKLILITDEDGIAISSDIIRQAQNDHKIDSHQCQLIFVSTEELSEEVRSTVETLQSYFTSKNDAYYRDFLFFFSLFVHRLLPHIENVILMDIDIKIRGDIAELNSHFSRFTSEQVIGMSHELSPVYRHILSPYRNRHKGTKVGGPPGDGGFPGFNSGVMLIKTNRMKTSQIIESYLRKEKLEETTKKYHFKGHLGDQDLYTLIALDHPEIFYTIPCEWNRQLCEWWRDKGYQKVFDEYFKCNEQIKLMHGNCKSKIPDGF